MNKQIENLKSVREFILNFTHDLTTEQLNEIPEGFSNNIIWNIAHLISAQQGVCYMRSGLPIVTEDKYFTLYKPGTKPEEFVDAAEIARIKELLLTTLAEFQLDYEQNAFVNYKIWTTRYGVEIINIDDIINFLEFHDGLHIGYIMALKRCIKK
ncbi:MAG: DinB family protein [Sphingobacteriales bacterium]|nr:DinB family protein [Sphingobacteriales bacterium]